MSFFIPSPSLSRCPVALSTHELVCFFQSNFAIVVLFITIPYFLNDGPFLSEYFLYWIESYLNGVFNRNMPSKKALNLL